MRMQGSSPPVTEARGRLSPVDAGFIHKRGCAAQRRCLSDGRADSCEGCDREVAREKVPSYHSPLSLVLGWRWGWSSTNVEKRYLPSISDAT